jgi:PIN domain nuclease of toxin-antitoxin system
VTVLVDTHAWLWMLTAPDRLPAPARDVVGDPGVEVLVSAASAWEIAIKYELGKLPLPEAPATYVPTRVAASGCTPIAVEHAHALRTGLLPQHHRDPFDRLLVAQAQVLGVPIVTGDRAISPYDVEVLWD